MVLHRDGADSFRWFATSFVNVQRRNSSSCCPPPCMVRLLDVKHDVCASPDVSSARPFSASHPQSLPKVPKTQTIRSASQECRTGVFQNCPTQSLNARSFQECPTPAVFQERPTPELFQECPTREFNRSTSQECPECPAINAEASQVPRTECPTAEVSQECPTSPPSMAGS